MVNLGSSRLRCPSGSDVEALDAVLSKVRASIMFMLGPEFVR